MKLRDIRQNDVRLITEWKRDDYVRYMALDDSTEITLESQIEDIERSIDSDYSIYKVIEIQNEAIGYVRIDWMDDYYTYAWLRFSLGKKRGHGYMRQALTLFIGELFQQGCHRVEAEVFVYNEPSIQTLLGVGFKQEGLKREAHIHEGKYYDVLVFGLLEEDFIGS